MAHVAFHFNVADPIDYVCRLTRKVRARQLTVLVCADPSDAQDIDQRLWTLSTPVFLAHAGPQAPTHVARRSPVRLCSDLGGEAPAQVLINLRSALPEHGGRFDRVVEVVPLDEPARAQARQRWRAYAAQGLQPERFDVGAAPEA